MPGLLRFTGAVKRDRRSRPGSRLRQASTFPSRALVRPYAPLRSRRSGTDARRFGTACLGDVPFAYVGVFTAHVNVGSSRAPVCLIALDCWKAPADKATCEA